tara:strand:- start:2838 stop:4163 length:1326 start_codon:yes stop_codon:yes gene_type:complete
MPLLRIFLFLIYLFSPFQISAENDRNWSESELDLIKLQWIKNLPNTTLDPSNKFQRNEKAISFGKLLFFEKSLSSNGIISCSTCHIPKKSFTDGKATAFGISKTNRNTPTLIGISHSPWFFWDGKSDSLWAQALHPLEAPEEHGSNRVAISRIIFDSPIYKNLYEELFGPMPDLNNLKRFPLSASPVGNSQQKLAWSKMRDADKEKITKIFVNLGKSLAAFQATIIPSWSRFDYYAKTALKDGKKTNLYFTESEVSGLELFIGKAQCVTCHQGPLFTNHGFHNIGVPDKKYMRSEYLLPIFYLLSKKPKEDFGRISAIDKVLKNEFNCLGVFSDAILEDCLELRFINKSRRELLGAFKVPTLRNINKTAPYMHAGQFDSISTLLQHYNEAPSAHVGHSELRPLNLSNQELYNLEAFLGTLDSMIDKNKSNDDSVISSLRNN